MTTIEPPLDIKPFQLRRFLTEAIVEPARKYNGASVEPTAFMHINSSQNDSGFCTNDATHITIGFHDSYVRPSDLFWRKNIPHLQEQLRGKLQAICGDDCPIETVKIKDNDSYASAEPLELQTFRIAVVDLKKSLPLSIHPFVKEEYANLLHHQKVLAHGSTLPDKWQSLLTARYDAPGDYFPVKEMIKLSNERFIRPITGQVNNQLILKQFTKSPELLKKTIARLESQGFRRIAYLGEGSSSLAFHTTPNKEGQQQILLLTPPAEDRVDNPLILPSLHKEEVTDGKQKLMIRIMPEVETKSLYIPGTREPTEQALQYVEQLRTLVAACGLKEYLGTALGQDLRVDNIGLYHYRDEAGVNRSVPMVLDWGSVVAPDGADMEALKEKWKTMDELKPWRDACAHIAKQQIENVLPDETLRHAARAFTHGYTRTSSLSETVKRIREGALAYKGDVDKASAAALEQCERDGQYAKFTERLNARLSERDPSLSSPAK